MNDYVMYKSQTDFAKALDVLKRAKLSSKTKRQIADFAKIRFAKGSSKLRMFK